jgi:GTP cyclohydrolase I
MSYNKSKTNPVLGLTVHEHLVKMGVETPMLSVRVPEYEPLDRKTKIETIEHHFRQIMYTLGLDLADDSLAETPNRVAKMYVNEIFWSLDLEAFPKCTTVENKMHYDTMVVERGIAVYSNCEHHILPIVGKATVAYIPKDKVLGLSKINRVVEYFSKRPQIQERLTEQIYHALQFILGTDDVAVMIEAEHLCVASRGVEDTGSSTVTSRLGGSFKSNPSTRSEFYQTARQGSVR